MPILGNNVAGAAHADQPAGKKLANKWLLPTGAYFTKLSVDCDGQGALAESLDAAIQGAIYTDLAGVPDERVAKTAAVTIAHTGAGAGAARAWVDLEFDEPVLIEEPGEYWLAFSVVGGKDDAVRLYDAGSGVGGYVNQTGLTDPFGSGTVPNLVWSIYGTYEFVVPDVVHPAIDGIRDAVVDQLGDLDVMIADAEGDDRLLRWINQGRRRLGIYLPKTASISWNAGDTQVALPADFARFDELIADSTSVLPRFLQRDRTAIAFVNPSAVTSGGTATLYYGALYPDLDDVSASTMPPEADDAVVSYVLSRFYSRIASSRADYRRYVSITGQNGVEVRDLLDLAAEYEREYETVRELLSFGGPASFYSD